MSTSYFPGFYPIVEKMFRLTLYYVVARFGFKWPTKLSCAYLIWRELSLACTVDSSQPSTESGPKEPLTLYVETTLAEPDRSHISGPLFGQLIIATDWGLEMKDPFGTGTKSFNAQYETGLRY